MAIIQSGAAVTSAPAQTGSAAAQAADGFEQLFMQLLEQIQAQLAEGGGDLPVDGQTLPLQLDGDELRAEVAARLQDAELPGEPLDEAAIGELIDRTLAELEQARAGAEEGAPLLPFNPEAAPADQAARDALAQQLADLVAARQRGEADGESAAPRPALEAPERIADAARQPGAGDEDQAARDRRVAMDSAAAAAARTALVEPAAVVATSQAAREAASPLTPAAAVAQAADLTRVDDGLAQGRARELSAPAAQQAAPLAATAAGDESAARRGAEGDAGRAARSVEPEPRQPITLQSEAELAPRHSAEPAAAKTVDLGGRNELSLASSFGAMLSSMLPKAEAQPTSPPPTLNQLNSLYQSAAGNQAAWAVPQRFGTPEWPSAASQRISWMASQGMGQAELRLDPPELGSLHVRLTLHQDQASLSFVSPNAHVREVLEQQMPRLREMLAESGIDLQRGDVSDQGGGRERDGRELGAGGAQTGALAGGESLPLEGARPAAGGGLSLVDAYA